MRRMTRRGGKGKVYLTGFADACWGGRPVGERAFCAGCHGAKDNRGVDRSKCGPLAMIDRLAAYEDTGLEPAEVAEYKRLCDSYVQAGLDAKFIQFCIDATQNGLTIGRVRELAQAEKDGRLVVLPCKPDAVAYQLEKGSDMSSLFRFVGVTINEDGEITYQTYWGETIKPEDFGKTVFLTRKEAEAALKKREEADNETD